MTRHRALAAALDLAAAAAQVHAAADLDRVLWPGLAALVGGERVAATGFDGAALAWPPDADPARHRTAVALRRQGAEARVALDRAGRPFTDREIALLHLVGPHLTEALWRVAYGPPARRLTAREQAIVARVARGATDAAIAHELGISRRTVGKHLENAYAALGVHDRTSAALRVARSS